MTQSEGPEQVVLCRPLPSLGLTPSVSPLLSQFFVVSTHHQLSFFYFIVIYDVDELDQDFFSCPRMLYQREEYLLRIHNWRRQIKLEAIRTLTIFFRMNCVILN